MFVRVDNILSISHPLKIFTLSLFFWEIDCQRLKIIKNNKIVHYFIKLMTTFAVNYFSYFQFSIKISENSFSTFSNRIRNSIFSEKSHLSCVFVLFHLVIANWRSLNWVFVLHHTTNKMWFVLFNSLSWQFYLFYISIKIHIIVNLLKVLDVLLIRTRSKIHVVFLNLCRWLSSWFEIFNYNSCTGIHTLCRTIRTTFSIKLHILTYQKFIHTHSVYFADKIRDLLQFYYSHNYVCDTDE
jgi:hypothetical protein